jgi:hypothetical protein
MHDFVVCSHRPSAVSTARFANTVFAFVYTIEVTAVLLVNSRLRNPAV